MPGMGELRFQYNFSVHSHDGQAIWLRHLVFLTSVLPRPEFTAAPEDSWSEAADLFLSEVKGYRCQ